MLRLGAIAIAVSPCVLVLALRGQSWVPWVAAALALLGALALSRRRPHARNLLMFGALLAAAAGLSAREATWPGATVPRLDLRTPASSLVALGDLEVQGFLRDEWTLSEFAVAEGQLPQQDGPASAVLVPLLATEEGPVPLRDRVVIARVAPGHERGSGLQLLRGHARPLEPELLATFVQASGLQPPPGLQGILLDTLDPRAQQAWIRGIIVILALLGALVCLLLATRAEDPPPPA